MSDPQPQYPKLPSSWEIVKYTLDGFAATSKRGVRVIYSFENHDEKKWIHVSCSRKTRVPSYDDMCYVKRLFLGEDSKAIMVFAPKETHVNIHPHCLHLYAPIDHDPLPEFSEVLPAGFRSI